MMKFFSSKKRGYGFGQMPGFNRRRFGSISNGDFDRDGKKNKGDCDAFNFRKQEGGEQFEGWLDDVSDFNQQLMKGYEEGEHDLIKERLEMHRLKKKKRRSE